MQKERLVNLHLNDLTVSQFVREYNRDLWKINSKNRVRPGGHQFLSYFGHLDSNLNGGADYKRYLKKRERFSNRRDTSKRLIEYLEDCQIELQELKDSIREMEEWYAFHDEYREPDDLAEIIAEAAYERAIDRHNEEMEQYYYDYS